MPIPQNKHERTLKSSWHCSHKRYRHRKVELASKTYRPIANSQQPPSNHLHHIKPVTEPARMEVGWIDKWWGFEWKCPSQDLNAWSPVGSTIWGMFWRFGFIGRSMSLETVFLSLNSPDHFQLLSLLHASGWNVSFMFLQPCLALDNMIPCHDGPLSPSSHKPK